MDDLITWLRARLDEDEAAALAVRDDRYGDNDGVGWKRWAIDAPDDGSWPRLSALGVDLAHSYADNVITPQRGEHIARWDPARVLAEVDAKRRMVDRLWDDSEGILRPGIASGTARPVLELLALPYADHPDYREGWRPDV